MTSLDEILKLPRAEGLAAFRKLLGDPEGAQREVLLDILKHTADSEWGRSHRLDEISSVEEFQARVPITDWDAYEAYSDRMQAGEESLLFPGRPLHFVMTTGTVHMKYLPESQRGADAKALVSKLRLSALEGLGYSLGQGKFLPLGNRGVLQHTSAGIPCGLASGLTLQATPEELRRRAVFPPEVQECDDGPSVDYLMMRFALVDPPRMVVGNNAGRLGILLDSAEARWDELLQDIESGQLSQQLQLTAELRARLQAMLSPNPERAAWLRAQGPSPKGYWPDLAVISCWLGGSVGRYLDTIKNRVPPTTQFIDCGYGSSEGKFNVPLCSGVPEGPPCLPALFFEFAPVDGPGPILLAHQVQDGQAYRLLITTYSGLLRYDMHDLVEVRGFTGKTPNLCFLSKAGDIGNLCGEKLYAFTVLEVVGEVCAQFGVAPTHFVLVAEGQRRGYDLCVESPQNVGLDFLQAFDSKLRASNIAYEYFRHQRLLAPPRLLCMNPGWQEALYRERLRPGVSRGQVKLPVLVNQLPHSELVQATFEL